MKWLLLFLLSVNVIIFVIQIKGAGEGVRSSQYVSEESAKDIKLLSEAGKEVKVRERCIVIGEIEDDAALKSLSVYLDAENINYDLIEKKKEMAPSYWVFAQQDETEGLIKKLERLGVDSYLVSDGDWMGKVSLGLFANVDLARDLMERLKKEGVGTMFVEKKKYKKSKWVSFKLSEASHSESLVGGLNALELNVGQIKEFFCKSIASEK